MSYVKNYLSPRGIFVKIEIPNGVTQYSETVVIQGDWFMYSSQTNVQTYEHTILVTCDTTNNTINIKPISTTAPLTTSGTTNSNIGIDVIAEVGGRGYANTNNCTLVIYTLKEDE